MSSNLPQLGSPIMTVTLELEPELESALEKRARAEGCDVKGYLEKLVEKEVNRERTFDEILAPFRDAVERSGISDEELDALFSEARREASRRQDEKSEQDNAAKMPRAVKHGES